MRPIYILFMTMILLPGTGFAKDSQDCRSACASDRESRYLNCPPPYEASDSAEEHAQCMQNSKTIYDNCISQCADTPAQPSSSEEPTSLAARSHSPDLGTHIEVSPGSY